MVASPSGHPADAVVPTYEVFQLRGALSLGREVYSEGELSKFKEDLLKRIKDNNMSHFYVDVCKRFNWAVDQQLKSDMDAKNEETLKLLEVAGKEAEKQYGDVEIKDSMLSTAHHFARIGDWDTAVKKYDDVLNCKAMESTAKVNIYLTLCRIYLFEKDAKKAGDFLTKAEKQFEKGGDWETRNRMKIYKALHLAQNERKFDKASELLIQSLATFTATELMDFPQFVCLTVLLSSVSLERPILKATVAKSPEVLLTLAENPVLKQFFESFMNCNYKDFFRAFIGASDLVKRDQYVTTHYRYFVRNMRLVAYRQYLRPYRSVRIAAMAEAFGVTEEFIEEELVSFVPSGMRTTRVDKIDRSLITFVEDVSVTQHSQFNTASDDLMNQLQMLSKVIDM